MASKKDRSGLILCMSGTFCCMLIVAIAIAMYAGAASIGWLFVIFLLGLGAFITFGMAIDGG